MTTTLLLLAGGASSRMGPRDKLLEDVGGKPLLRARAEVCLAAKPDALRVVLPPDCPQREEALRGLDVEILHNEGSAHGLSHSLMCGAQGVQTDNLLIVLADLPDLTGAHLTKTMDAAAAHPLASILRGATDEGRAGHPVLIRRALYPELAGLTGDTGAKPLLQRHRADTVLVPIGPAALRDLDTPEDWAAWREENRP